MLGKPASVASDPFKSAKWDELTAGRDFSQSDAPALTLLVQWYAVAQRCIDDMDDAGGQVAYTNELGDLRALPQIATVKQASAEIRQLSRQLGVDDEARRQGARDGGGGAEVLRLIIVNEPNVVDDGPTVSGIRSMTAGRTAPKWSKLFASRCRGFWGLGRKEAGTPPVS